MTLVQKVTSQQRDVLDYLLEDPVSNGFAVEDFRCPPKDGEFYISTDGTIRGYLMNHYEGKDVFVELRGDTDSVASELMEHLPLDKGFRAYISTEPSRGKVLRDFLQSKNQQFTEHSEHLMALTREQVKLVEPNPAAIVPEKYETQVAQLITESDSREYVEINRIALSEKRIWGVIINEIVVSVAGIAVRQPETACIVNVVTHPDYRRRGFGTLATSAATSDALNSSKFCSLFVATDNFDAIRIYERLGYKSYRDSIRFEQRV